jgi:general secretion pathway protein G
MRHALRPGLNGRRPDAGYTLTEMLVVIGIIGLIAAVLTPGVINELARAKAKAAQLQLDTLTADVEAYQSDVGHYPAQDLGLQALLKEPTTDQGWTGPYIRDARMLNDPWGRPVIYTLDAQKRAFSVKSLGADGKAGGSGVDRDLQSPAKP